MDNHILPEFDLDKTANTLGDEIAKMVIEKLIKQNALAPVVHGKWIERWHENKHVIGDMACSVCGTQMLLTFPKYCPECGAKMDGDK